MLMTFVLITGLLIYFFYGLHHSLENKPMSSYSQIITYTEPAVVTPAKLHEHIHAPQPRDEGYQNRDGAYQNQYEESTEDDRTE